MFAERLPEEAGQVAVHRVVGQIWYDTTPPVGSRTRLELEATTGLGQISVTVPFDAHVVARGRTGLGRVWIGNEGTPHGLDRVFERRWEPRRGDGATIVLDLEVGIGDVTVYRTSATRQQLRERAGGVEIVKRHAFDAISFVFGLAFLATGLAFLVGGVRLRDLDPSLGWIVPTLLLGVTALIVGIGRLRSGSISPVDDGGARPDDDLDPAGDHPDGGPENA